MILYMVQLTELSRHLENDLITLKLYLLGPSLLKVKQHSSMRIALYEFDTFIKNKT